MSCDPLKRIRPLNHAEARSLARELWGEHGMVEVRHDAPYNLRCVVGTVGAAPENRALGRGADWESAFADAEKRGRSGN